MTSSTEVAKTLNDENVKMYELDKNQANKTLQLFLLLLVFE